MTEIDFIANFIRPRCVLKRIRTREMWDRVAGKWMDRPADGSIPDNCVFTPDRYCDQGLTSSHWSWSASIDPEDLDGASLSIYMADADGKITSQAVDLYTNQFLREFYWTRGGWQPR